MSKWLVVSDFEARVVMDDEQSVKSFRDLVVWQRSIELCLAMYEYTRGFPSDELYGPRSQLRRATVSIPSNIAEGCGRRSTGELIQFASIARGSNFEVQTQLVISNKLRYGSSSSHAQCLQLSTEVERMLNAWINSLKERKSNL